MVFNGDNGVTGLYKDFLCCIFAASLMGEIPTTVVMRSLACRCVVVALLLEGHRDLWLPVWFFVSPSWYIAAVIAGQTFAIRCC
jgi:hypothetical protein